jgi:tRNA G18 (ribose-2'-O)-methylase SpoU
MNLVRIESLDDPRVAAYRNLRDRTLRGERMFVAEGGLLVTRLLASRFAAESLLLAEPRVASQPPATLGNASHDLHFVESCASTAPRSAAAPAYLSLL